MTKTNVLIVEDEIIVAKNTEVMLRGLDYNVVGICTSGEKALIAVAEKKPDVILMDIVLGGDIDGIQTAAKILKESEVPIIFATSYSDNETLKRAKKTAPYGYIIKPFQKKELLAGIEIALERHALEQKIRENEQLLQTTLQSISDGIITTDKKGNILYINEIGEAITGWAEDVKGKSLNSVFRITCDSTNKETFKLIDNPSYIKKLTKISSSTLITRDGSTKIVEGSISPIFKITGETAGSVLAFRDITIIDKAQRVQNALYNISNAVNATDSIQELFQSIQQHLGEIIDTTNFYVALYDKETDTISLPYIIDEEDKFTSFPAGKTLTGYVIKHKKPLLAHDNLIKEMTKKGLIESVGSPSKIWLGVPLRIEKQVIGVVAVQSYEDENLYTKDDLEILEFVSEQLAIAISHKRAEDAQRIERAYFEQLFENAPEAIVLIDNESRILRMNDEFTRTFGYTIDEARNKKIDTLLTRGEYRDEAKNVTDKIAHGETVTFDTIRWHKNGTPVDVSILGTPIIFEGGQLAVYGIYRNISDRKITEEALRKSEERYRELIENVHDIIYRFDTKGIITYINAVGEKIFGLPSDEIVGKSTLDIVDNENRVTLKHFYQRQFLEETPNTYNEFEIVNPKGKKKWLGQNTSLLFENKKIIGFQAVARDITEQKKVVNALSASERKFKNVFKNNPIGIGTLDRKGYITSINETFTHLVGMREKDLSPKQKITSLLSFSDERMQSSIENLINDDIAFDYETELKNLMTGNQFFIRFRGIPLKESSTKSVSHIVLTGDITARKHAEDALRQRTQELNERVQELNCLYKISDIVEDPEISMEMVLSNSLEIIAQAWKYPEITYVKITWINEIFATENYKSTDWHISEDIVSYNKVLGSIEVGYLESRSEDFIGPFSKEESNLLHAVSDQLGRIAERKLAEDKLKDANKKLELLARTDPLTQLSNRRDILEKIKYEKRRFSRSEKPFAIIICDIDDFKSINDRFGHDTGDEVLKTLANIMCMNVRKQDTVSRWGGEEFLLLLPQTDIDGGLILAEKIRVKVKSKEFNFLGKNIHVSITMGLSIYKESKTIDETINQADQALYMGKKLGKNCVKCETDLIK